MKRTQETWSRHLNGEWIDEYPDCSMFEYLKRNSNKRPEYIALEFQGKKITYKDLIIQVEYTAKALIAAGIKKGDIISVISVNIPQAVIMIYAANRIGAIANMIHPLLSKKEMCEFIENTDSAAVFILDQIYPKIKDISWKKGFNPKIIVATISEALPVYLRSVYNLKNRFKLSVNPEHDIITWKNLLNLAKNKKEELTADTGKADDTAIIMYSGGTTGLPKGIMLTNLNFNSYAIQVYYVSGMPDIAGNKTLAVLPLFHGFGLATCIHSTLCSGMHLYLMPKFDPQKSIDLVFKKKINCICAIPSLFEALRRHPKIETQDLSFIKTLITGGDKLQKNLYIKLSSMLEKGNSSGKLCDAYGQTECVSGCIANPYFAVNPESVGIMQPDMIGKIVKPGTHEEVPNGTDGELCVCGPTVMKGYYKNEEETKMVLQVHPDGKTWLHTGDMFSRDDEGYFYFKQRISRMIISAGYNIYVTQVEKAILNCSAVEQCCVVGVTDKVRGQKIRAHVVLRSASADKETVKKKILEKCEENLPEYSIPHDIRFCESLPVTNLGKIDFKALENEK